MSEQETKIIENTIQKDTEKQNIQKIIQTLKVIITALCEQSVAIHPRLADNRLLIDVRCSAEETPIMIGKGGRTKFAIKQLLDVKAKRLGLDNTIIDLWVRQQESLGEPAKTN